MAQSPLLFRPNPVDDEPMVVTRLTAERAGWEYLNMEVRRLKRGEQWRHETANFESAVIILGGQASVDSDAGKWENLGKRARVFEGMPTACYFSRNRQFTVTAERDVLEVAHCWVETTEDHPTALIRPEDCAIEIRGGNNATRQINSIIPPGFDCDKIVCVEVFTPNGNWSSYPGHKHDKHQLDKQGVLVEADLEEIYYYKINNQGERQKGFAIQRVYTDDRVLDETVIASDNDIVLIPEGYHPVSAADGYDCYYLNFLAGSAQSLMATDDPDYAWIKDSWTTKDPRVPMVGREQWQAQQARKEAVPV